MIVNIRDLDIEELRPFWSATERQLLRMREPAPGYFIAESPNVILRALEAGYTPVSFLVDESELGRADMQFLRNYTETPVYAAPTALLQQLTGFPMTRGALCLLERRSFLTPQELCAGLKRIAVLEDVVNPTNIGAIFRSAAALGVEAVLLTKGCCDPLYRRSSRVSMGTVFQVPWTWLPEDNWQEQLHAMQFRSVAMALRKDSYALGDPVFSDIERLAVVLGTEGEGLRAETIESSDYTVMIPMTNGVDSLNVAAASAVAFWELCGKRA